MGSASESSAPVPRLRLDELLDELQARLDSARGTRDRIHSLLEAVLSVGRELELTQALHHIVEAAVTLVDAEYGALGVIGEDQRLSQFVPVGLSEQRIKLIGALPSGHGVLGELIRHPEPLRLSRISDHPASYGFPANHPPMSSFLGVPIRVRDRVFGNLYLTEKRGGAEFDAEDESVLATLAVAAGVAIDNARLYARARLREQWLAASAEVTSALLSGKEEQDVLDLLVARAAGISGADLAVVALPLPDGGALEVRIAAGLGEQAHRGLVLPVHGSFVGAAVLTGGLVVSPDVRKDPRITSGPPRWEGLGPAVAVPIGTTEHRVRGVLMLARAAGSALFGEEESGPLLGFAGQAAVAMELAERRRDSEQVALLRERDRIARDLHDLAIQRLFATGMTLQGATRFIDHPEASDRVLRAIDDLDETARTIRATIFGLRLRESGPAATGLRSRVVEVIERAARTLGFTPGLRMSGLLDVTVPAEIADAAVAVLEEALSNVARHANAGSAEVTLTAGTELSLTVTDDGVGLPAGGRRSGLANLADRAAALSGTFTAGPRTESGGTALEWRVPLANEGTSGQPAQ
ncbi:GAF domain-containing protein [Streptomyces sp. CB01881]|uniref:GAF domain-containing sensor histidine kinase n=1 Tax=Streptomyces sp. CB01881 TaxID=2078691 RepID=UPI000CDC6F15|nr:GAF domain-containing protein [Streptomyces sp. CB01881]AUY47685.1 histidine kinase [Streptomyces sp. CB01881]TYC76159.1 GAF domain-containing protein [Streptomyces sp. CB01881]